MMNRRHFLSRSAGALAVARSLDGAAPLPAPARPHDLEAPAPGRRPVIIDTDPGTDDAMAILLALNSPELDVKAITVVPGNVTAAQGLDNALRLVSLADRCDVPVAHGAEHPLNQTLVTAEYWHGLNGLANINLPKSRCREDTRFAAELIIELIRQYPHELTLLLIGPETNVALAVSKDPSIATLVREVIVMGGSLSEGNVNAVAEANIYGDPEAAQIVFSAGWPLTMVGLDVCDRTLVMPRHVAELARTRGPQNDFVVGLLNFLEKVSAQNGFEGTAMYDQLAIGTAINPAFISTRAMRVDIETRGEFTRGETVGNRLDLVERHAPHQGHLWIAGLDHVTPNARVALEVRAEDFIQFFIGRIAGK